MGLKGTLALCTLALYTLTLCPEYELSKFLDNFIKPYIPDRYLLKSTDHFTEKLKQFQFGKNQVTVSFDVVSLFTNVPLSESTVFRSNIHLSQIAYLRSNILISDRIYLSQIEYTLIEYTLILSQIEYTPKTIQMQLLSIEISLKS